MRQAGQRVEFAWDSNGDITQLEYLVHCGCCHKTIKWFSTADTSLGTF